MEWLTDWAGWHIIMPFLWAVGAAAVYFVTRQYPMMLTRQAMPRDLAREARELERLTALMRRAIEELRAENEALRARVRELEERLKGVA